MYGGAHSTRASTKQRILIIEGDPAMGGWLFEELHQNGFQVALATTGVEGMDLLRSACADIVISDMEQDDLPGADLLREVQELGGVHKVILTTSLGSERQADHASRLGASAVLRRPFRMERLLEFLERD